MRGVGNVAEDFTWERRKWLFIIDGFKEVTASDDSDLYFVLQLFSYVIFS